MSRVMVLFGLVLCCCPLLQGQWIESRIFKTSEMLRQRRVMIMRLGVFEKFADLLVRAVARRAAELQPQ